MRNDVRRMLQELLDRLGDDLAGRVRALAEPLKQGLDERLVGETSAERRKRFEGLKARIEGGWDDFAQTFDAAFRRDVAVRGGWQADDDREAARGLSSLKLVDDDEVDWDLALAGAVSRMKAAGGSVLSEFEQRVNGLLADATATNPLSLDAAGVALKRGIEELAGESTERRALLAYIEPLLSKEMQPLCTVANEFLAERGVGLPRLKPAVAAGRAAVAGSGGSGGGGGGGGGGGDGNVSGDVLSLLQRLVQNSPGGATGDAAGPAGGSPGGGGGPTLGAGMVAVPAAMLESLERLQAIDLQVVQSGQMPAGGEAVHGGNVLRELRQQEFAQQLPPIEAATIDIVAMLFDFIFDDRLVPDTVKALVGRLQIPLLKVAMLDKSFFSNREHPARAMLDAISRVSIAAGADLDHGHPVFEKIRETVNQVLTRFEKDHGIFATLLPEVQALLAGQEQLANELAEKSKAVAERQEAADLAEVRADETFQRVFAENAGDAVPAPVRDFLARHWTLVLRFAYLKGGASGHPWSLALQTLTDLLWSLTPKSGAEERQKLIALLPDLLRRVNAYLDRVGVSAEAKAPFLDALVEIHSGALKGVRRVRKSKPAAAEVVAPEELTPPPAGGGDAASAVVVSKVYEEGGLHVESMAVAGKPPATRAGRSGEAGRLERGDWLEFKQDDGSLVRGRLSWVSPQRGIMLFTNPQSTKAISISPEALALQMKRGLAVRLSEADEPLVDRALGRAMDSLQAV